jgi:hypothetical protein
MLVSPVWTGKMTGMFSRPYNEKQFLATANIIEKDNLFSRIFYIPSRTPLGYSSPTHPSAEAIRMLSKRPFEIGVVGTYEQFNYLREAPFMGELFSVYGIKYIYYPFPDTRREALKQDNIDYYYAFLDQLTNLPWIEKRISEPPVAVLQTKKTKDHFFIAPNTYYIVGSDRIYSDLIEIPGFNLSENALIFAEEKPQVLNNFRNTPIANVLLYGKSETDLVASLIDKSEMIFPAQDIKRDPSKDNLWWKRDTGDFLWWRNFLQTKYQIDNQDFDFQAGWAIAEGDLGLTINDSRFMSGNMLLARVLKSSRGGRMEFWQGTEKIGEINTLDENPEKIDITLSGYGDIPDQISTYNKSDLNWYEIGKLTNNSQPLTIKTFGDLNVINVIASFSDQEWNRANRVINQNIILDWTKLSESDKKRLIRANNDAQIFYTRISPIQYKVEVKGLTQSATLAFSETYDPLWQANGTSSYPLYSLINGFMIDKDGTYDIYFSPQRYVLPGLAVSTLTLVLIIGILVYPKLRNGL